MSAVRRGRGEAVPRRSRTNDKAKNEKEEQLLHQLSTMRVSTLVDLVDRCRQEGLSRIFARQKPKLRWWVRLAYMIALLRIVCVVFLAVIGYHFRYKIFSIVVSFLGDNKADLVTAMVNEGLFAWTFLVFLFVTLEIILCVSFYFQIPIAIGHVYAANLVFAVCLITIFAFAAGFVDYADELVPMMVGSSIRSNNQTLDFKLDVLQQDFKCCGFTTPTDALASRYFYFVDPLTEVLYGIPQQMRYKCWMEKEKEVMCSMASCCTKQSRCNVKFSTTATDIQELEDRWNYQLATADDFQVIGKTETFFDKGCLPVLVAIIRKELEATKTAVAFFVFLTLVMTILVIVILLYRGGLGMIRKSTKTIRPVRKNTLVKFFMWLDGLLPTRPKEYDLTDFSIIEELKNVNVDNEIGAQPQLVQPKSMQFDYL